MAKHYDVVVLGAGIGALAAAALLARRSWRVLVVGQGYRPAEYAFEGFPLARRPFTFLSGASPAWGRVVAELAQSQAFRRRLRPLDPMVQILAPGVRLSLPPDSALLGREIDREFPEVRRVVDELYAELGRSNATFDAAFERDVVWPPGTFWERRETVRAAASLPYLGAGGGALLAEFPREHPYRRIVETTARFASDLGTTLPPFAVARLHGAWTRGMWEVLRGEADVTEFLVDRIRAHGGEVKLESRVSQVITRFGRATGVRVDGEDEVTGVQFVVSEEPSPALLDLATEYRPTRRALDSRPRIDVVASRFVTSILVRDEGLPAALGAELLVLPGPGTKPVLHVQRAATVAAVPGTTLLVAETFVGKGHPFEADDLPRARAAVVAAVEAALPYVERHYVMIDSPHDGLPLWDYRSGPRELVDRADLRGGGASLEAEPMVPLVRVDDPDAGGLAGLGGEPIRYPLGATFGVGRSIVPALGQEGELLAAWGVARTITRTDRRREKMRREMWSKVELG